MTTGEQRERAVETKDRLIKRHEVAKRYGCSVRTVDRMCQRGEGPEPVRIGPRMVRFWESEVERYLGGESQSAGAPTEEDEPASDYYMSPAQAENH